MTTQDNRTYKTVSTTELLDYVAKNCKNPNGSIVEAIIYKGVIKCTHFFDYFEYEDMYEHEGIDGERAKLSASDILGLYPTTLWVIFDEQ